MGFFVFLVFVGCGLFVPLLLLLLFAWEVFCCFFVCFFGLSC